MARIQPVDDNNPEQAIQEVLGMVKKQMGTVPNMIATMANSPAVAGAYLGFSQTLSSGALSARLREQIALVVSETTGCDYCIAAHTMLGKSAGLSEVQTTDARLGISSDSRERAALELARRIVLSRGQVTDRDLMLARQAGFSEKEICEIVANVVLNLFSNYFNLVAGTELDFPRRHN